MANVNKLFAQNSTEHPFIDPKDIKSDTCIKCHPNEANGKFVHAAVGLGCESCHTATSEMNRTIITDIATGGNLCALCHDAKKDAVPHEPYKTGQCLVCHDPHASNYPDEIRASANTLCLSCHGLGQPAVQANSATKLVTMIGNQTVPYDDYRRAPKLELDPGGITGHPIAGHPLIGKDPRNKDGTLSCLSCHAPHSSALPKLMPAGVTSPSDLCAECHKSGARP